MQYNPSIGVIENIKVLFSKTTNTGNNFINHKSEYDVDHITMEQALTEADINNIVAEQSLTDMDIRLSVLESEAK